MNEELAALERALRRAAKERAEREAALETLRTDLEDSMVAHGDAEAHLEAERAARQDTARRLLTEQARCWHNAVPLSLLAPASVRRPAMHGRFYAHRSRQATPYS